MTDTYTRIVAWHKTFTEAVTMTDTYTRIVAWYRTFTEKIKLTDTVIKVKSNLVQLWRKLMNLFNIEG